MKEPLGTGQRPNRVGKIRLKRQGDCAITSASDKAGIDQALVVLGGALAVPSTRNPLSGAEFLFEGLGGIGSS